MKISFWSIGKSHESYVNKGIEEFTNRINNYMQADWLLIPTAKNAASLSQSELKKKEAELILSKLQKEDYLVLLDERGKQFTSIALANMIEARAKAASKKLVFLIGGAFGVDESIITRANIVWSLSPLVFPHQLVRLILAEQVYRAFTIIKNEKYHHQ